MILLPLAQTTAAIAGATSQPAISLPSIDMGFWLLALAGMALLPFILTMVTSFAKIVIVGGIIRQALGTQNIPPNTVITGLALILTLHIMAPVATEIYSNYQTRSQTQPGSSADGGTVSGYLRNFSTSALPVIRSFLHDHADERNRVMFRQMSQQLSKRQGAAPTSQATFSPEISQVIDDLTIQAPAFILTELTQAFQIGFLIFVPFLVVDLVVSSILLSMGMHMLSPTTISLPLKLLLFVAIDGWTLILRGLALGYAR